MTVKPKKRARLKPYQALTLKQICTLPRDNVGGKGWWAVLDGGVVISVISNQKAGESSTGCVTLTRREFERLARWYLTGRMTRAKRSRARR